MGENKCKIIPKGGGGAAQLSTRLMLTYTQTINIPTPISQTTDSSILGVEF